MWIKECGLNPNLIPRYNYAFRFVIEVNIRRFNLLYLVKVSQFYNIRPCLKIDFRYF